MKSTLELQQSRMESFIEGFNGTQAAENARLNTVGRMARVLRQMFALMLIVLILPLTTGSLLGQSYDPTPPDQQGPPPPQDMYPDQGAPPGESEMPDQGAPQGQPMSPDQLGQLVAPIALYPDALVAQVLAASTYPSQVVEANRWVQSQGNLSAEQIAAAANGQNWDPSVKALVAFPSVLAQLDKNIRWTTDLGNAYYNQPGDVMGAVQTMRSRAQSAGTLRSTPQQMVSDEDGAIEIAPVNPEVVYVPTYDPWGVYGTPMDAFPGYYYGQPSGVYFGSGLAIGFGIGVGVGVYSNWGWGYHNWRPNWRDRRVFYNHNRYITRSRTVYNRGWNRPGGPHGNVGRRGGFNRGRDFNHGGQNNFNRNGQNFNRGGQNVNRGNGGVNRGGTANRPAQGSFNRGGQNSNRGGQNVNRGNAGVNRGGAANRPAQGSFNRGGQNPNRGGQQNFNRGGQQNFNRGGQNFNRGGQAPSAVRPSGGFSGGSRGGGGGNFSRGGGGGNRGGGGGHAGGSGR